MGYPMYPGQNLPAFLKAATLSPIQKKAEIEAGPNPEEILRYTAERMIWGVLSPATGLIMDEHHMEQFDKYSPLPKTANPFAAQGGSILDYFKRIHTYMRCNSPDMPALSLCIMDADLLFDSDAPMAELEKTLLSFIRQWASRPLITIDHRAHRIFLISPSRAGIRSALMQGRISSVKIPLPNEENRKSFIERVFKQLANEDPIAIEEGLDIPLLARITGALNLIQIEDVIYQAQRKAGLLTRALVQERKDELINTTYGQVIEIEYPTLGFDSIVGYEELKRYFKLYVYPLLATGDPGCPKGCILAGSPGSGKSMLPKTLAAELKLPLVTIRSDKIKSKYVGESNKNMAKLQEGIVALAPCIVLFDELDKGVGATDDNTGVSQEILASLQTFMSEIVRGTAFFVGTTNYPSRIPRALLRPGRFEEVIPMLPQHLDGLRGEALQVILKTQIQKPHEAGIDWDAIGDLAKDYTGADLGKLLISAHRIAVMDGRREIAFKDLKAAVGNMIPTLSETKEMVEEAIRFCSDKSNIPASMQKGVQRIITEGQPSRRRVINEN